MKEVGVSVVHEVHVAELVHLVLHLRHHVGLLLRLAVARLSRPVHWSHLRMSLGQLVVGSHGEKWLDEDISLDHRLCQVRAGRALGVVYRLLGCVRHCVFGVFVIIGNLLMVLLLLVASENRVSFDRFFVAVGMGVWVVKRLMDIVFVVMNWLNVMLLIILVAQSFVRAVVYDFTDHGGGLVMIRSQIMLEVGLGVMVHHWLAVGMVGLLTALLSRFLSRLLVGFLMVGNGGRM